jgi:hypothetical protein
MRSTLLSGTDLDPIAARLHLRDAIRDEPRAGRDRGLRQRGVEVGATEDAQPRGVDLDHRSAGVLEHETAWLDREERRRIEPFEGRQKGVGDRAAAGLLARARGPVQRDRDSRPSERERGGGPRWTGADDADF